MDTLTLEERIAMLPKEALRSFPVGKFAPKLTEDERCTILALMRSGVKRAVVAAVFGLDPRTVGHIANDYSVHYRPTRRKWEQMGREDFLEKYLTSDAIKKVREFQGDPVSVPPAETQKVPDSRYKGKAGIHLIQDPSLKKSHRIEIKWRGKDEEPELFGWWYRDLDSDAPEEWFHNGDESRLTSSDALKWATLNVTD